MSSRGSRAVKGAGFRSQCVVLRRFESCPCTNIFNGVSKISQRFDEVPANSKTMPSRSEHHSLDLNKDGKVDAGDISHIF